MFPAASASIATFWCSCTASTPASTEARDRAAQIVADSRFGGVAVLFTWPTKHELFGYVSDKDSAMASRDALQGLLQDVAATPGVGKIHVLAHSMGGWLAMEALRQASIAGNRDLGGHLGEVMLASPDIDMDVFAAQMSHLRPANVTVFATANDRALSLSSALAQSRQRVGAINPSKPEDRRELESLGAKVYDLTKFRRLHRSRRLRQRARGAARHRRANGGAAGPGLRAHVDHRRQRLRRPGRGPGAGGDAGGGPAAGAAASPTPAAALAAPVAPQPTRPQSSPRRSRRRRRRRARRRRPLLKRS